MNGRNNPAGNPSTMLWAVLGLAALGTGIFLIVSPRARAAIPDGIGIPDIPPIGDDPDEVGSFLVVLTNVPIESVKLEATLQTTDDPPTYELEYERFIGPVTTFTFSLTGVPAPGVWNLDIRLLNDDDEIVGTASSIGLSLGVGVTIPLSLTVQRL